MKLSAYRGLLWVFAAGILGISLLCSVSGMAMQDLNVATAMALQPADVVESFVENLNTAAAVTLEAFEELAATPTSTQPPPQATVTSSPAPSNTPVVFIFPTSGEPTRTRRPRPTLVPTRTPVPPSRTPIPPTRTNTPLPPTATDTPVPDTPTSPPDTPTSPPVTPTYTLEPLPTTPPAATAGISGVTPTSGAPSTPMP